MRLDAITETMVDVLDLQTGYCLSGVISIGSWSQSWQEEHRCVGQDASAVGLSEEMAGTRDLPETWTRDMGKHGWSIPLPVPRRE